MTPEACRPGRWTAVRADLAPREVVASRTSQGTRSAGSARLPSSPPVAGHDEAYGSAGRPCSQERGGIAGGVLGDRGACETVAAPSDAAHAPRSRCGARRRSGGRERVAQVHRARAGEISGLVPPVPAGSAVCTAQPSTVSGRVRTRPPWTVPIGSWTDSSGGQVRPRPARRSSPRTPSWPRSGAAAPPRRPRRAGGPGRPCSSVLRTRRAGRPRSPPGGARARGRHRSAGPRRR